MKLRRILLLLIALLAVNALAIVPVHGLLYQRYEGSMTDIPENCAVIPFRSGENELTGYYFQGARPDTVVLAPGFHACGLDLLPLAEGLMDRGWSVFTFDPTGAGRSGGDSQGSFAQIAEDTLAAVDAAASQPSIGAGKILLFGHSRGAYGAAAALERVDGAVLAGGVESSLGCEMQAAKSYIGPLAELNRPWLKLYLALTDGEEARRRASRDVLLSRTPVLVIQSAEDAVVRGEASLFAFLGEEGREGLETLLLEGGHTSALYEADGTIDARLLEAVDAFFIQVCEM